ncbi:MAG TPA: EAL domain-containing protein [Candidatus Limnocylindrales bacterium]
MARPIAGKRHPATASVRRRRLRVDGRIAWLGLAASLVFLAAAGLWATTTSGQAARRAADLSVESDAFQEARYAVGAEESLERKYRLDPSPEVRSQHSVAAQQLIAALLQVENTARAHSSTLDETGDVALVTRLLALHGQYLAAAQQLFAAYDAGDVARSESIDATEVDPPFGEIEASIEAAASSRQQAALAALAQLREAQATAQGTMPVAFAIAFTLLGLFWFVLSGYQRRVRRSEERFRSLVQHASDIVAIVGPDRRLAYVSPAVGPLLGLEAASLVGTDAVDLVHRDDAAAARAHLEEAGAAPGTVLATELRLVDGHGGWREFEVLANNLLDQPAVAGMVLTYRDVTERKAFVRQLAYEAFHDPLTDLPNRALFVDRLGQALARATRRDTSVGVLFLDLDNFKIVNDSLGHQLGDELLVGVATRLRSAVRAADTVARMGGDEFTILLEDVTEAAEAVEVAERIREAFRAPFAIAGRDVFMTASVGVAVAAGAGRTADSLLRDADLAMYRAKASGKARHCVFEHGMEAPAVERLAVDADLRKALERHEFRVHYQPIVTLVGGCVSEFEALVRWERPGHGLVLPASFIPLAEENGLIVPLGRWVLEEACREAAAWPPGPGGRPIVVSVNLSARQLQDPDLVTHVERALAVGPTRPALKLEITESVAMLDPELTSRTLRRLKALGVLIAIDDFGTGYSSLSYLKRFPLDALKIDRSFVDGLRTDGHDAAIVQSVIALARSLGLAVTGEGVETVEQAADLRALGCELAQGFLYARPLAAEAARAVAAVGAIGAPGTRASPKAGRGRAPLAPATDALPPG